MADGVLGPAFGEAELVQMNKRTTRNVHFDTRPSEVAYTPSGGSEWWVNSSDPDDVEPVSGLGAWSRQMQQQATVPETSSSSTTVDRCTDRCSETCAVS
eukprot:CAMPEP_0194523508 /NCGR_PEP_ID=MMETSP0253-20130528/58413_1 /TAXON_ID=2966 /ORGANISM="Noctiluca scintillans" /LENGTH=98 /DNA_ID=CAMNT_0039368053 /DNA_START=32 /DNA_END=328 /DNA_ORIENTATION=+